MRAAVARHAELQRAAGHDLTTQGHLFRYMVMQDVPTLLREWFRRRLATMLERQPDFGEVSLCVARVRIVLEAMRLFVGLAVLRLIGHAWPTSRRMDGGAGSCRFGCMAIGGDDVQHCLSCPRMCSFAAQGRAAPPSWAFEGQLRLALGASAECRALKHSYSFSLSLGPSLCNVGSARILCTAEASSHFSSLVYHFLCAPLVAPTVLTS